MLLHASVSIEADSERVDQLLSELEGKSIEEVIASGVSKLASVPSGGGGGGGAAAGGGGGGAAAGVQALYIAQQIHNIVVCDFWLDSWSERITNSILHI